MKVNFTRPVTDLFGNPLPEKNQEATVKTLQSVVCTSLFAAQAPKAGENLQETYHTYRLLQRIAAASGEVEISVEEAAIIKREVVKNYVIGVAGQVFDAIENAQ